LKLPGQDPESGTGSTRAVGPLPPKKLIGAAYIGGAGQAFPWLRKTFTLKKKPAHAVTFVNPEPLALFADVIAAGEAPSRLRVNVAPGRSMYATLQLLPDR